MNCDVVVPGRLVAFCAKALETLSKPTRRDSMLDTVYVVGKDGAKMDTPVGLFSYTLSSLRVSGDQ
jgi:hypothetical protein